MATRSNPQPDSFLAHQRIDYPAVSQGNWRIGCTCGWNGKLPAKDPTKPWEDLDALFVAHVPAESLRTYVLVDQRASQADPEKPRGNFLMPEGVPCLFDRHWEDDGLRWVHLVEPVEGDFPVGEVRTENGRVFKAE